ncbi:hypothetical protein [Neomegalonema sp.]|uniref:hypothetical protein n=1 Tax=Neomegalonema sp. TaxID=2039713 RepID=UPI00261F0D30|nr:hypothetical protein [Neomegalonema sp.]MDD2868199.1 hypothetical protein [Neomegalonema sp.]
MKLIFRRPAEAGSLAAPRLAREALPDWLKAMPAQAWSEVAGAELRTLKHCPPFLDAMRAGVLLPLAEDLHFDGEDFSWSGDPEAPPLAERSPIGIHAPEQAQGAPFAPKGEFIVKFLNRWAIETPPGWSLLVVHPFNRLDLPFRTLAGIVEADLFRLGLIHFPALWVDPDFRGILPKGTPVAQILPIPREPLQIELRPLTPEEAAEQAALRESLATEPGVYRRLRTGD